MKPVLFFLVSVMSFGIVSAQEVNCVEKQKEFSELVSKQLFKQANELLPVIRKKCLSPNEPFYQDGITLMQYNIGEASEANKEAAIRDLLKFYDQYDATFPKNQNGNGVNKAMVLYNNKKGDDKEILSYLDKAFTANKDQFTDPNALYVYLKLYVDAYKSKTQTITFDQLMGKYADVMAVAEKNGEAYPKKTVDFKNAERASKSLLKEFITSENVIASAEKGFEANNKNAGWLSANANLLNDKAPSSPIYGKVATQLHELQPTSKSAYHLANFNLKTKNTKQAIEYFKQAATLTTVPSDKAKIYYSTAVILASSDKSEARKMITSAIDNEPSNGSYYMFLANLYMNSVNDCGASPLDKKAIYKLADQVAQKGAQVEPRLKPTAEEFSKQYAKNSPTKPEMDQLDKMGRKVAISCWINETVQF